MKYDEFEPAYRTGWESYDANSKFEDRENDLQRKWEATKGKSKLTWDKAKLAAKDAWDRASPARRIVAFNQRLDNYPRRLGRCRGFFFDLLSL